MIQPSPVVSIMLALLITGVAVAAEAQPDLLANGDFEALTDGKPNDWSLFFTGSSAGWVEKTIRFNVPSGTSVFSVMPAMFQVKSGTLDAAAVPAK